MEVRWSKHPGRLAAVGLGAAVALYAVLQLWLTRGTTVFVDEIRMFEENTGIHPSGLLTPFNEHLELARRLLYAVTFKLFGAGTGFQIARLTEVLGVALLALVMFILLRRRVGPLAALAPTVLVLFFGSAWELNFVISGIGNVYAMAAGLGALALLERRDRRTDWLACLLLICSVASFTTGLAFAAGALVWLVLEPGWRRRLWVALVPIGLYAAWIVWLHTGYVTTDGEVQHITLSNLLLVPNMIFQQGASTAGALAGLNYDFNSTSIFAPFSTGSAFGAPLFVLAAGLLVWRLRRPVTPLVWALLAVLLVYWLELAIGFGEGRNPTTVRYVYTAGTVGLVLIGEAAGDALRGRGALIALYGVVALALLGNVARLRDGMRLFRTFGTTARAQLAAIEMGGKAIPPGYTFQVAGFAPVATGVYQAAVQRNGSPAYSPSQLSDQSNTLRLAADRAFVATEQIKLTALTGAPPASCSPVALGPGGVLLRGPKVVVISSRAAATAALARYSDPPGVTLGAVPASTRTAFRIPADRSARPWRLSMSSATPGAVGVCVVSGG